MKNAQRNKKIYAICISLLFVISSSAAFIPSIQVKAETYSNAYYWKDLPFLNDLTGDNLFSYTLYEDGVQNASVNNLYSDGILKGVNTTYNGVSYFYYNDTNTTGESRFNTAKNFFDSKDTNVLGASFNSRYFYSDWASSSPNYERDNMIFSNYEDYHIYRVITLTQNGQVNIDLYFCTNEIKAFLTTGGGLFLDNPQADIIKVTGLTGYNNGNMAINSTIISYSSTIGTVNNVVYTDFPVYFYYEANEFSDTQYSTVNSINAIKDCLLNNSFTDFLIDRRTLFSNFTDGGFTVDTDPVSINELGLWKLSAYVTGGALDGQLNLRYVPTQALSSYDDIQIETTYSFFANGKSVITGSNYYMSNHLNIKSKNIHGTRYFGGTGRKDVNNYSSSDYQSYNMGGILKSIYGKAPSSPYYTNSSGGSQPLNAYETIQGCIEAGVLTQSTVNELDWQFGATYVASIIMSSGGTEAGLASCFMTVTCRAFYDGGDTTEVSSCTYDFVTGKIIVNNTVSSDNDSPISDYPSGSNEQEFQELIGDLSFTVNNSGGGSGSGSGGTGGTGGTGQGGNATANANNEINVKSNWQYFIDSTEESTENEHGLTSIQEGYEEVINFDYENDSFLMFLFSSGIWSIHPFDYILAFLGTMVTIGIFTGILKLFRG